MRSENLLPPFLAFPLNDAVANHSLFAFHDSFYQRMEWFLRKLHHLMALCPGIQSAVHQERRHDIGKGRYGSGCLVEGIAAEQQFHTLAHEFLFGIGRAKFLKLLPPLIDLFAEVDLDGADGLTAQTERAGRHVARMSLRIAQHAEVDAYRTGDEIAVRVASAATVHRAGVHAGTAADALQYLPVLRIAYPLTATVVHEDDVHFLCRWTGFAEVRSVGGRGLSRSGTAQHALEDGQALVVRDDFLQTDGRNVQLRTGG